MGNSGSIKRALARRFLSLTTGEAASVLVFAALYLHFQQRAGTPFGPGVLYPFLLLEFLLLQGSAYWLNRWLRLRSGVLTSAPGLLLVFRLLHLLNVLLLLALPLWVWFDPARLPWSVVLGVFALVEFINYFHWRLAYPVPEFLQRLTRWRFPISVLAQELRRQP